MWQYFRVAWTPASEAGERWRDEIAAERMLARLDLFEDLAELASEHAISSMQSGLRTRYRTLMGIGVEHRAVLRSALQRVADGHAQWSDEVEQLLGDTAYQNGTSS